MTITVTPAAGAQLRGLLDGNLGPESGLRVWVQAACGCGSVGYGMGLDDLGEGDTLLDSEGIRIIVDAGSASLLGGATIDFIDNGLHGSGFVLHTPDEASGGCGCGGGCGGH